MNDFAPSTARLINTLMLARLGVCCNFVYIMWFLLFLFFSLPISIENYFFMLEYLSIIIQVLFSAMRFVH